MVSVTPLNLQEGITEEIQRQKEPRIWGVQLLVNCIFFTGLKKATISTNTFPLDTYPESTPSTRLSIKKDPMMMRGMKYSQFQALPEASLLWRKKEDEVIEY